MKTRKPLYLNERKTIKNILFEKTGYGLKDYLIEQAFTRSSYSKRFGGGSNENLEYIGDTILGYHIVHQLFDHYGALHCDEEECRYTFRAHEKDFTALKSLIVSNHTLAKIIEEWNVCQFLIVGQSDIDNEIDKSEKIKADLFEAIIGAYAVQYKWSTITMNKIISRVLPIDRFILEYEKKQYRNPIFSAENAISTLKELAEHEKCQFPEYEIVGPDKNGHDKSGNPWWSCNCSLDGYGTYDIRKIIYAHSKKDAKKFAAYLVLCEMFELPNEYGPSKAVLGWYYDGEKLNPGLPNLDY